ncbi:MAG: hypothetical protein ABJA34_09670, partial [Pseudonocardiales bacterium]
MATATATAPPVAPQAPAYSPGRARAKRALQYTALIILTLIFISPLIWMAVTSFKTQSDAIASSPQWVPRHPTTHAFSSILNASGTPVLRWFFNSVLAATAQAALVVATAAMAAYALARMDFPGKRAIFAMILSTLFVPGVILIIPNYVIVSHLKWLDSLPAIIVPGAASAFGVFFLRQF